jgi:hypothetical protein
VILTGRAQLRGRSKHFELDLLDPDQLEDLPGLVGRFPSRSAGFIFRAAPDLFGQFASALVGRHHAIVAANLVDSISVRDWCCSRHLKEHSDMSSVNSAARRARCAVARLLRYEKRAINHSK